MKVVIEIDLNNTCVNEEGESLEDIIKSVVRSNVEYQLKKSTEYKMYIKNETDKIISKLGENQ